LCGAARRLGVLLSCEPRQQLQLSMESAESPRVVIGASDSCRRTRSSSLDPTSSTLCLGRATANGATSFLGRRPDSGSGRCAKGGWVVCNGSIAVRRTVSARSSSSASGAQPPPSCSKDGATSHPFAARDAQPETRSPRRAARDAQPETRSPRRAARDAQPETRSPICDAQPETHSPRCTARDAQPETRSPMCLEKGCPLHM
jgi:hypothetical protein